MGRLRPQKQLASRDSLPEPVGYGPLGDVSFPALSSSPGGRSSTLHFTIYMMHKPGIWYAGRSRQRSMAAHADRSPGEVELVGRRPKTAGRARHRAPSAGSQPTGDDGHARALPLVTGEEVISPAERLSQFARLFHVTRMFASELDLAEISHQILVSAIDVIPAADAGTLYLADTTTGKLRAQDCVGLGPSIHKLSLEPGEGAAGKAYFSRHGAIYNDPEAVSGALVGASDDNVEAFRDATRGLRSPRAAMTAPLIFKGSALGALVVDQLGDNGERFGAHDLRLLEDLAQIAAIGIMNARLFDSERSARLRLQVMNDELNRQRDMLDRRLRALDAMAGVAREGFSLYAIASRLAVLACGRAVILDSLGRVRAVAPPDLEPGNGAQTVRLAEVAETVERVSADHQRHVRETGDRLLIASPVMAELEVVGYVVLELSEPEPDGIPEALADYAAMIASTVFVREQAREEGDLRRRADLLERLLKGDIPRAAAKFHEFRPPFRLAVGGMHRIGGKARPTGAQYAGMLRELRSIAAEAVQQQTPAGAVTLRDDHVVAAWSAAGMKHGPDWTELFRGIADAMGTHDGWSTRFALTQVIDDPRALPQAYREARLALEIRQSAENAVIDVGELGAYRLILGATSNADAVAFSHKTLSAILDRDEKRNGNLLPTLRAYLAAGMSLTATAKALHVHVHTVQYRLAKLEELSGLSLRKGEERLTLELSLRIHDLARADAAIPGGHAAR